MKYDSVDWRSIDLFKDVTEEQWHDWRWQLKHAIHDVETLEKVISLTDQERAHLKECLQKFTMAITPYYAALMDRNDPSCPVRLQAVPRIQELHDDPSDLSDPLHEDVDSPVPGLTHRYPDRVLLLVTNICSMNCRHCTRRRLVGDTDVDMPEEQIAKAIEYIRKIDHVEIIRIGTRTPVVMPQRITDSLVAMLKKYHPVFINTHFNHAKEITAEARAACAKLADAGIPLGNQSVLLRGINDRTEVMKQLVHKLLTIRVRPYYIYQCDLSMGISHFRTSVDKGIEIIEGLRGHTTGLAVPTFVVDAPGGGGKIPVMPNYLISRSSNRVVLRNYEGVITTYTEPVQTVEVAPARIQPEGTGKSYAAKDGVATLLSGDRLCLEPADLSRKQRKF
jgi:lysine 2,3-aminomutase